MPSTDSQTNNGSTDAPDTRRLPWSYTEKTPAVGFTGIHQDGRPVPALFTPLTIRGLTLKNRIGVSPMCQYSAEDGFLKDWHLVHLGQFAAGGAALVIQEATAVQEIGRISQYCPGIWKDEQIPMMARIVDFVHSQSAAAGIQLAHAGRKASTPALFLDDRGHKTRLEASEGGWPDEVVAPSAIPWNVGWIVPRALTIDEIKTIQRDFVSATERAIKAGFDFLEIHAAHGYLINEFLSPLSNHRTDEFGGSFENRVRFLLELVKLVRAAWPQDKPLSVRLSCTEWVEGGWDSSDTVRLVPLLLEAGVDVIDTSTGGNDPRQKIAVGPLYQLPFAQDIKKALGKSAVLTAPVGMITDPKQANEIIESGDGDLVLLARELLRDPHWPMRAAKELGYDITYAPQYQRCKLR